MAESPLLRLQLPDGTPATLLVGEASTVLSVDERLVSSWDLAGRPYALVRENGTYRRGLDGRLLLKSDPAPEAPRVRRRLSASEGMPVIEAARREAGLALDELTRMPPRSAAGGAPAGTAIGPEAPTPLPACGPQASPAFPEARRRLARIVAMDAAALEDDASRFLEICGPVGILPPDRYLSLVVRVTEGCSWNACTFCRLYRGVPFRAKTVPELRRHIAALREYFGDAVALRRDVFLGDANALCLSQGRLLPLVETLAAELPEASLFSFVDAWTGQRRTTGEWRTYSRLGLRRVYVGLETGDAALLSWLGKPGSPGDAVELVHALHRAGVAAGVIVLVGAGGERFASSHAARTADVLTRMGLGPADFVYYSDLVEEEGLEYAQRAGSAPDLQPLSPERCREQRRAIQTGVRPADPSRPPRSATYDIREFVY